MIVGFNHNVSYKGVGFHVQTEDSGVKSPQLVTLLYHAGTIISSKKTIYADIIKVDNLSKVVEDLAKEQHKGMLRRLTQGEFDERIVALGIPLLDVSPPVVPPPVRELASEPVLVAEPLPEAQQIDPSRPEVVAEPQPVKIIEAPIVDKFRQRKPKANREPSLDDLIYAYLCGSDKC